MSDLFPVRLIVFRSAIVKQTRRGVRLLIALIKPHSASVPFPRTHARGRWVFRYQGRAQPRDKAVAAFPGPRLRHFQKQGSVKEELMRSGSRVQVELKLRSRQAPK